MRRFENGMEATVKQVLRQKLRWRHGWKTVEAKFGKSIVGLPIIPCVLNNLPYARIGEHEGVYLYDYSSLKRFMTSGTLNPRSVATFGNEDRRELRTTLKYGRGESPTAEDLLEQLKEPVALKILLAHTETDHRTLYLDEETLVISDEIHREDVTDKSMVELSGKSWSGVRMQQDRFAKKAKKSRLKEERSRKAATKPFWK